MMPSITNADTIPLERIKSLAADLLKITREVDEWRNDHDPGTQEWYTLCNLAESVDSLILSLPVEMLPEKEWRHVSPAEYTACDELLAVLKEGEQK